MSYAYSSSDETSQITVPKNLHLRYRRLALERNQRIVDMMRDAMIAHLKLIDPENKSLKP